MITSGDYGFQHDASQFTVGDLHGVMDQQQGTTNTGLAEFAQLVLRPISLTDMGSFVGTLQMAMAYAGLKSGWTAVINGLDIRPITTVGLITIERVKQSDATLDGLKLTTRPPLYPVDQDADPVSADGLTLDYYRGTNAVPNAVITVTSTDGTVVPVNQLVGGSLTVVPDLDRYLQGRPSPERRPGQLLFRYSAPIGDGRGRHFHLQYLDDHRLGDRRSVLRPSGRNLRSELPGDIDQNSDYVAAIRL